MGLHWFLSTANGRSSIVHDVGTGGYSSFVALDRAAKRAVVSLSDTALTSVGGFGTLGRHLLDPSVPVDAPRIVASAAAKQIDALLGPPQLTAICIGDNVIDSYSGTAAGSSTPDCLRWLALTRRHTTKSSASPQCDDPRAEAPA